MSEETFSLEAFIFVIILIIYILTSHLIEVKKVPYLHESTMAIFMGVLTAAFAKYVQTIFFRAWEKKSSFQTSSFSPSSSRPSFSPLAIAWESHYSSRISEWSGFWASSEPLSDSFSWQLFSSSSTLTFLTPSASANSWWSAVSCAPQIP